MSQLINGSAHDLSEISDGSVHCIVTSPPYFALRNYAGEQSVDWPDMQYCPMPGIDYLVEVPAMTCGLGNEPTLDAYIGHLVLCLREWWRILRADGTCWLNLGDSFARGGQDGLKPKDKMLVPHRFALAAKADGWWVRQDCVWAKKNSIPESVTDRPTTNHEFIFLLTKSARYYYDHIAVQTPLKQTSLDRIRQPTFDRQTGGAKDYANGTNPNNSARNTLENLAVKFGGNESVGGANLRSVFHIATRPYPGSHFAVFPEDIPEIAIKAGTSARGVCPQCGAGWVRVVETTGEWRAQHEREAKHNGEIYRVNPGGGLAGKNTSRIYEIVGWSPSCACPDHTPIPATVCDPFTGSGTTGRVALRLGRSYIGVDISQEYLKEIAPERMRNVQMKIQF